MYVWIWPNLKVFIIRVPKRSLCANDDTGVQSGTLDLCKTDCFCAVLGGGVIAGWIGVRSVYRWRRSGSWTAWEQGAERGRNYYNSGVTRDMSNTGHMGFTAKGLWGNGHRLQPQGEVRLMVLQSDMSWSQRKDRAISLHLGLAPGDRRWALQVIVGAAHMTAAALRSVRLSVCVSVSLSASPGASRLI